MMLLAVHEPSWA